MLEDYSTFALRFARVRLSLIPFLIHIFILFAGIQAAEARIFTPVSEHNGLDARIVSTLMVDNQGFLWVGSREGLYRYDGYEAQAFLPEAGNPKAINDIDIRSVFEDRNGIVWVGTNSGGLNRYDPLTREFNSFQHDPADPTSLSDNTIYSISEGPRGQLWVATGHGLNRLDAETGKFEHFRHDPDDPASLTRGETFRLHLSVNGNLWAGTMGGGINLWNPEHGNFTRYDLATLTGGPAIRNDVYALFQDQNNRLWVGTRDGLVCLHIETGLAEFIDLDQSDGYFPFVTSIQADNSGRLWLTTKTRGLLVFDPETREWQAASPEPLGTADNLPTDELTSIAMASELVFVGTWGSGVYRAPIRTTGFHLLNMQNAQELGNSVISAVMATSEDGSPWVGTFGGGPRRVDVTGHAVKAMPLKRHGVQESGVMSLAGPIDGRLYAATTLGLYEFSEDGTQLALFRHDPQFSNGIGSGYVTSLLAATGSGLWVGMGGSGLYYFETETQRFTSYRHEANRPDSLSDDYITALLLDRTGYIWVGTRSNGLNLCRVKDWSCQRFIADGDLPLGLNTHSVTALYRDRRGRTWVATDGGGLLLVLRDEEGRVTGFQRHGREHGLLNDRIMAIQEDQDESLWLSTRQGLSRFSPGTGNVFNYVSASGLPVSHFNANASAADDRFIYFGSTNGLLSIPKGSLLARRDLADVRIASVTLTRNGQVQTTASWPGGELRLPYQDVISIELAVLDFAESGYQYAYRLHESDPWQDMGQQRQFKFYSLAPGRYELQARGRNVYGIWGESETLILEIIPPFWMATWFRVLVIILFLSLAVSLHLANRTRLQRRTSEMLRLGAVRERALEEKLGAESELTQLTPRQKEILQLIAEGKATREIAGLLNVSVKTVEAHRANLMERLEIYDVPGLVRLAIRSRLVSLQD